MKILLLYASIDGQTQMIARHIADELYPEIECELVDLLRVKEINWSQYQGVIIGASIRYGHFHPQLMRFVKQHVTWLNHYPSAFYSVNLTARKPDKCSPQTNVYTRKFLAKSPWRPTLCEVFAGGLYYPRYSWLDKRMLRFVMWLTGGETDMSKEIEYTDWQQVSRFTVAFASAIKLKMGGAAPL